MKQLHHLGSDWTKVGHTFLHQGAQMLISSIDKVMDELHLWTISNIEIPAHSITNIPIIRTGTCTLGTPCAFDVQANNSKPSISYVASYTPEKWDWTRPWTSNICKPLKYSWQNTFLLDSFSCTLNIRIDKISLSSRQIKLSMKRKMMYYIVSHKLLNLCSPAERHS